MGFGLATVYNDGNGCVGYTGAGVRWWQVWTPAMVLLVTTLSRMEQTLVYPDSNHHQLLPESNEYPGFLSPVQVVRVRGVVLHTIHPEQAAEENQNEGDELLLDVIKVGPQFLNVETPALGVVGRRTRPEGLQMR